MEITNKEVWVFIEQRSGVPADVSLELLSKGRKLADTLQGELKALILGHNVQSIAEKAFTYGVDEAIVIDALALEHYRTAPYSRLVSNLILERNPRILLFGATVIGRDLAPYVASKTKSGLTADCTDLKIEDVVYLKKSYPQLLLQIRPAFGGNIIATIITPDTVTQMATVREGVMEMHKADSPKPFKVESIPYEADPIDEIVQIIEQHREENKVNLKSAPIIVAGGYGLSTKDNFKLVKELAHLLGGEFAGSRAAVDAGFVTPERQVGQTGVTVRPKLYIAIGISGAIQHRAGMQESQKIIAINNDPDAPIFSIAHYGIVGDASDVLPKLIEAYKNKLK